MALRKPCLATTTVSRTPLARAVRIKSSCSTSTNEARVKRAITAATAAPSVIDGST
ncbi:hypothetical protein D9M69_597550 [compost metagenome]